MQLATNEKSDSLLWSRSLSLMLTLLTAIYSYRMKTRSLIFYMYMDLKTSSA